MMESWDEIRAWRRAMRAELISRRVAVPRDKKESVRTIVGDLIREHFPELCRACIGFYWPFKGEVDFRHLVRDFHSAGAEAALPVVVEKQQPLEFWSWQPRMKMSRGIWNIPIPAKRQAVRPTALLVPLLGFDSSGYRLGYGGGYYDRTLATLHPKPLTIGVGYELGRLETIYPQPHDIPLDATVTEKGLECFRYRGQQIDAVDASGMTTSQEEKRNGGEHAYASPPCFLHDVDPAYLGSMSGSEVLALLNELLEGERAGAKALAEMAKQAAGTWYAATMHDIAMDEARFCAMLARHITRFGGAPSPQTGAFYNKLLSKDSPAARMALLDRGQGWVVRKLHEALPRIADGALHRDLTDMLMVHENNIRRCAALR